MRFRLMRILTGNKNERSCAVALVFINSAREDPSLFRGWDESAAPLTFWTHPLARPIGLTLMRISDTLAPSYIDNGRAFH